MSTRSRPFALSGMASAPPPDPRRNRRASPDTARVARHASHVAADVCRPRGPDGRAHGRPARTHGAQVVADAALGLARPGVPMTPDTLMPWMSCTKLVTSVAFAIAWERGLVALDAPVADYVPEFAAGGKAGITLRHLLTHTAGLPNADAPSGRFGTRTLRTTCPSRATPAIPAGRRGRARWPHDLGHAHARRGHPGADRRSPRSRESCAARDGRLVVGMPPEYRAHGDRLGVIRHQRRGRASPASGAPHGEPAGADHPRRQWLRPDARAGPRPRDAARRRAGRG